MKSKVFFAIAVFLSLGHSSLVLSAQSCCAKFEESLTCLPILETYLSQAISAMYDAHTPLYNTLISLSADMEYNDCEPLPRPEDIETIDGAALDRYHDGIDRSLNAIHIATGNDCNLEDARTKIYATVDRGARILPAVAAAALSGNYPDTEAKIESARIKVVNSTQTKWIGTVYDNVRRCANTIDNETLAATQSPQQASTTTIGQAINGYFNAFKLVDVAITYRENGTLLDDIRECQGKTSLGLRRQMNNYFSLLEALCVKRLLGRYTGSVSVLFKIQLSSIGRSTDVQQTIDLYFQQIERLAKRYIFRLADDSDIVYSRTAQAQAQTGFMIARIASQFLDAIAALRPEDSKQVAEARNTLSKIGNDIAAAWFSFITVALSAAGQCGNSSAIETQMVKIESQILDLIRTLPQSRIDIIRGKQVFNTEDEAQFMRIMEKISKYNYDYVKSLRAAAEILARDVCKGKTTGPNDITTIRAIGREASTAITNGVRAAAEILRFCLCVKSGG